MYPSFKLYIKRHRGLPDKEVRNDVFFTLFIKNSELFNYFLYESLLDSAFNHIILLFLQLYENL